MTIYFYHHNKIRHSGFYFTFQGKISSTQWISPVKDGFSCVALLRLRGFLHALRLVEMTIPPQKKPSSQPKSCHSERKRSMSFRGHIMPEETPGTGLSPGKVVLPCKNNWLSTVISSVVERSPNEWHEQGQTKKPYTFFTTMSFRAIHGAKREFMTKSIHDA